MFCSHTHTAHTAPPPRTPHTHVCQILSISQTCGPPAPSSEFRDSKGREAHRRRRGRGKAALISQGREPGRFPGGTRRLRSQEAAGGVRGCTPVRAVVGIPELKGCHRAPWTAPSWLSAAVPGHSCPLVASRGAAGLVLRACLCLRRVSECPVGLRAHLRVPVRLPCCVRPMYLQTQADPPLQEGGWGWVGVISPRGTGWGRASQGTQPRPVPRLEKVQLAEVAEAEAPRGRAAGSRGGSESEGGAA